MPHTVRSMPVRRFLSVVRSPVMVLLAGFVFPLVADAQSGQTARAAARQYREKNEATILQEFRTLLSLPNIASNLADIRRNADHLVGMLQQRGIAARVLEVDGGPVSVFGELTAPGASRTLMLYAHFDGQPVDRAQWSGDPFSPVLRDGPLYAGATEVPFPNAGEHVSREARVYARSASDDKGSIIAMLSALDALQASGLNRSVNLKFFFEGEEEAGSAHLEAILRKYRDLLDADAWLFCDGPVHQSGQSQVVFGLRGVLGLELTVYGPSRPLHSGHYGNWAPNPGALIANLVASMRTDDGEATVAGFSDDVKPISAAERAALASLPPVDSVLRSSLGLARTEADNGILAERIMRPAINVRGIRVGGVQDNSANVISTEAYASFDFRLVPDQSPDHVREVIERHISGQGYHITYDEPDKVTRLQYARIARLQWEAGYPAQRTAMDSDFGKALLGALSDGTNAPPLAVPTLGGSGPAYLFTRILGAPVVTLPLANHDNNQHASNENLRIGNLWDGIEMYAALVTGIGKRWPSRVVP